MDDDEFLAESFDDTKQIKDFQLNASAAEFIPTKVVRSAKEVYNPDTVNDPGGQTLYLHYNDDRKGTFANRNPQWEVADFGNVMPKNVRHQRARGVCGNILPDMRPSTRALDVPGMLACGHGFRIKSEHIAFWIMLEAKKAATTNRMDLVPWYIVLGNFSPGSFQFHVNAYKDWYDANIGNLGTDYVRNPSTCEFGNLDVQTKIYQSAAFAREYIYSMEFVQKCSQFPKNKDERMREAMEDIDKALTAFSTALFLQFQYFQQFM